MSALEQTADPLFRAGDWAKASTAYESVAKAEPKNGRAHLRHGVALLNLNQHQAAVKALEDAVALGFNAPVANFSLARGLARLGHTADAFAALQAAVQAGYANLQQLQGHADLASLRSDARFAALVTQVERSLRPCEFDDNFKAFDFWVGDWFLIPAGTPANTPQSALPQNRIEKIANGCALLETYTPANFIGKSLNTYNPTTGKWVQLWVDSTGRTIQFIGEVRDGNMYFTSDAPNAQGQRVLSKLTYLRKPEDRIHQTWETSTDGGKTWSVGFDAIYVRKSQQN